MTALVAIGAATFLALLQIAGMHLAYAIFRRLNARGEITIRGVAWFGSIGSQHRLAWYWADEAGCVYGPYLTRRGASGAQELYRMWLDDDLGPLRRFLGYTWVGWVNLVILRWFFVRIYYVLNERAPGARAAARSRWVARYGIAWGIWPIPWSPVRRVGGRK